MFNLQRLNIDNIKYIQLEKQMHRFNKKKSSFNLFNNHLRDLHNLNLYKSNMKDRENKREYSTFSKILEQCVI